MKKMTDLRVWTGFVLLSAMVLAGCTQQADDGNDSWDIGSADHAQMAEQAMTHLSNFEFDAWGEMLADDIEYYFPDGDAGTRTLITGKAALLDWWKNWETTSGIESMTFSNTVFLPIVAQEAPNYAGLTGPYVVSYMSNEMVFNGNTAKVRMNFTVHFNDENKIDRYYSYYDRTPIITAMGTNILSETVEE